MKVVTKNTGHYWKPNRGWFDSIEIRYIPDVAARTQALISGQIDAANRLDPKTVGFVLKSPIGRRRAEQGVGQPLRLRGAVRRPPASPPTTPGWR